MGNSDNYLSADVLDRVMSSMRDASAQPSLPPSLRLAIFELVELRASKWMLPSDSSNYYRQRRNINVRLRCKYLNDVNI